MRDTRSRRLSTDRRYFARPARSLFNEVRSHFAIGDQLRVWNVIESNISLALDLLERAPELLDLDGAPRECRAHTRKGTPCQREPLHGRDYCPSHKHLEETFEAAEVELPATTGAGSRLVSGYAAAGRRRVGQGKREGPAGEPGPLPAGGGMP